MKRLPGVQFANHARNRPYSLRILPIQAERVSASSALILTHRFPDEEKFGLVSQMRRASVSIPSNIAEGAARNSASDYARFLTIALGSLSELDTQLELAKRLSYCDEENFHRLDEQQASISRMLIALRRKVRESSTK